MDRGPRTDASRTRVLDRVFTELIVGFDMGNIAWLAFFYGKVNGVLKSNDLTPTTI